MKIIGNKIIIRELSFKDEVAFYEYGKCLNVGPNAGWKPFTSKTVAHNVLGSQIISRETFAIALKENDLLIGTISLYNNSIRKYNKAKSLGFSLHENYWNQGIMTEAVKLMIKYVFSKTDCEILEVGHHSGNYGSKRVIEKCGFNFDGRLAKFKKLYDGRLIDADFYSMTKEEYERMIKYE